MGRGSESALATDEAMPPLAEPEWVNGRYRVTGRLGGGRMGEVFEVEHTRLKRHFALKLLRAELSHHNELKERFAREVQAMATLRSDYVVSIVDAGSLEDGRPYFVMERLVGQDLRRLLVERSALPVPRAVNLAIDVCLGLHAAHGAGLVHRDLKPENLFVTQSDEGRDRCKILDFGVVKLAEQDHTEPGTLLGTARYMAPEQIQHDAPVGPPADLFALGVILYRSLSGVHPFDADSLEQVLFRVMNDTPSPLGSLASHVPAELATLVERTLSKSPAQRPQSALELAQRLAPFAGEARSLGAMDGWHVESALDSEGTFGEGMANRPTPTEGLPAVTDVRERPRRGHRALPLVFVAAASIVGTLAAERWSPPRNVAAEPTVTRTPAAKPTTLAPRIEPPRAASAVASAPALIPSTPPSAPVRSAKAPLRPLASAASSSEASTTRPSVNWFDPRNPYAR